MPRSQLTLLSLGFRGLGFRAGLGQLLQAASTSGTLENRGDSSSHSFNWSHCRLVK